MFSKGSRKFRRPHTNFPPTSGCYVNPQATRDNVRSSNPTAPPHRGFFPTLFCIRRRSAVGRAQTTGPRSQAVVMREDMFPSPAGRSHQRAHECGRRPQASKHFYQLDYTTEDVVLMWIRSVKNRYYINLARKTIKSCPSCLPFVMRPCCLSKIMSLIVKENGLTNFTPREKPF